MPYFSFMTICDFLAMNETDQTEAIWCNTHIAERQEGKYWILLYQLDSFYVELYYDQQDSEIQGVKPFISTDQLEPYLNQIDISDIYQLT